MRFRTLLNGLALLPLSACTNSLAVADDRFDCKY